MHDDFDDTCTFMAPKFSHPILCICLGFETGAKLFKCSTICPMLGLPHDSGQCHRPRQLWLRVPCLFAFDCFRTWSFHRVWTCLASLDITIPAKKAEGLHNKTWVNTFNHHIPSTNLLNKRLPHDCFHSKQILTVRNEDMKWYFYAYICITSSSNQHKSRLLEHCPGIYKKSYSIAMRQQHPEKGAVSVGLCCIWKIQFASLYVFRVPVCFLTCWSFLCEHVLMGFEGDT